jgi:hypothetical protein
MQCEKKALNISEGSAGTFSGVQAGAKGFLRPGCWVNNPIRKNAQS